MIRSANPVPDAIEQLNPEGPPAGLRGRAGRHPTRPARPPRFHRFGCRATKPCWSTGPSTSAGAVAGRGRARSQQIEAEVTGVFQPAVKAEPKIKKVQESAAQARSPTGPVVVSGPARRPGSKVYYVIGEVNAPGVFPITGRETVLDGVFAAGNMTRKASTRKIICPAPRRRTAAGSCCRSAGTTSPNSPTRRTNYQLLPGDRVRRRRRGRSGLLARCNGECPPCNRGCRCPCGNVAGCVARLRVPDAGGPRQPPAFESAPRPSTCRAPTTPASLTATRWCADHIGR